MPHMVYVCVYEGDNVFSIRLPVNIYICGSPSLNSKGLHKLEMVVSVNLYISAGMHVLK